MDVVLASFERTMPEIKTKRCSKCNKVKPAHDFYLSRRNRGGHCSQCKSCILRYKRAYHKKLSGRRRSEISHGDTKRCSKCHEEKPISEFYKAIGKPDGHSVLCKECASRSAAERRRRSADRDFDEIQVRGKKKCSFCHKRLPVEEFNYCRSSHDGLTSYCRQCGKDYKRQHYEENYGEFYNRQSEYRRRYPERRRVFSVVQEGLKRGELVRPDTCSKCGKSGYIVAHHDDYGRPLEIVWLCLSCDRQLHADLRRGR